jgi:hypothetical protein
MHRTTSYYGGEGEGTGLLCLSIALHVISSLHIILWRAPVGSRALTIRHNSPILSVEGVRVLRRKPDCGLAPHSSIIGPGSPIESFVVVLTNRNAMCCARTISYLSCLWGGGSFLFCVCPHLNHGNRKAGISFCLLLVCMLSGGPMCWWVGPILSRHVRALRAQHNFLHRTRTVKYLYSRCLH